MIYTHLAAAVTAALAVWFFQDNRYTAELAELRLEHANAVIKATSTQRAWQIAIGFDQLVNVAANGDVDETISSRAHRARTEGRRWGCVLCGLLDKFDRDHCLKSAGT